MCSLSSNKRSWPVSREAEGVCHFLKRQHFNTKLGAALNGRDGWGWTVGQLRCFPPLRVQTPKWAVVMGRRGGKGRGKEYNRFLLQESLAQFNRL